MTTSEGTTQSIEEAVDSLERATGRNEEDQDHEIAVIEARQENGAGKSLSRWLILIMMCWLFLSLSYSNTLKPLKSHIVQHMAIRDLESFDTKFDWLEVIDFAPNLILPVVVGYFLDRQGPSFYVYLGSTILTVGQVIFTLGVMKNRWVILYVGRSLTAIASGPTRTAAEYFLVQIFLPTNQLSLSFACTYLAIEGGAMLLRTFVNRFSLLVSLWVSVGLSTLCFVSVLVLLFLEEKACSEGAEMKMATPPSENELTERLIASEEPGDNRESDQAENERERERACCGFGFVCIAACAIANLGLLLLQETIGHTLMDNYFFRAPPQDCMLQHGEICTSGGLAWKDNPSFNSHGDSCPGENYAPVLPSSIDMPGAYYLANVTASDALCKSFFWGQGCARNYCSERAVAEQRVQSLSRVTYFTSIGTVLFLAFVNGALRHPLLSGAATPLMLGLSFLWTFFACPFPLIASVLLAFAIASYHALLVPTVLRRLPRAGMGIALGCLEALQSAAAGVVSLRMVR